MPATAHFLPVSLSVFGAVGEASRPFFNHLLTQLAYTSNRPFAEVATHYWITQSVLIRLRPSAGPYSLSNAAASSSPTRFHLLSMTLPTPLNGVGRLFCIAVAK